jgi:hypothetical protein
VASTARLWAELSATLVWSWMRWPRRRSVRSTLHSVVEVASAAAAWQFMAAAIPAERAPGNQACPASVSDNRIVQQRLDRVVLAGGTAVSYATVGAGRPLVYVMGWLTHLQLSWELPAERALYEALAQGCRLVRYDRAGCGLSAAADRPASLAFELEQLGTCQDF